MVLVRRFQSRLASRLLSLVLVVWAVTIATFMLANVLPGDPVLAILGEDATPETIAAWRERLGLDQPLPVRYVEWLTNALQGDLGFSYQTNEQTLDLILERLPVTLEILVLTQIVALSLAVPAAILSAWRSKGPFDRATMTTSLGLLAMPPFLIAIGLIYTFSVKLGWLPATGFRPLSDGIWANLRSVALPTLALALNEFPVYQRLLRADMMQTLQQDYISVARAKGLSNARILLRHALKPSSFTLLTVVGVNIGRLLGGTIIIEVLFGLPGLGQLMIQSVYQQDYLVLQGLVLFMAVSFVVVNAIVDGVYVLLDPRTSDD